MTCTSATLKLFLNRHSTGQESSNPNHSRYNQRHHLIPAFLHRSTGGICCGLGFFLFPFLLVLRHKGKKVLKTVLKCLQIWNTSPVPTVVRHPTASGQCKLIHWIIQRSQTWKDIRLYFYLRQNSVLFSQIQETEEYVCSNDLS